MGETFSCLLEDLIEKNQIRLSRRQRAYLKCKRVLDWVISLVALFVLMPLFALIALVIKLDSPCEKVVFKQDRVGRGGKTFTLYKFRTMTSGTPEMSTVEMKDADVYITRVGRFLRKTSLDELPQIWNVFCGSMSIIGPRPLIKNEKEIHYLRNYYGVYQIRPGITGLAQINGRDMVTCYDKVRLDRTYLRNLSFGQDFKILWITGLKVLRCDGVAYSRPQRKHDLTEKSTGTINNHEETVRDAMNIKV